MEGSGRDVRKMGRRELRKARPSPTVLPPRCLRKSVSLGTVTRPGLPAVPGGRLQTERGTRERGSCKDRNKYLPRVFIIINTKGKKAEFPGDYQVQHVVYFA